MSNLHGQGPPRSAPAGSPGRAADGSAFRALDFNKVEDEFECWSLYDPGTLWGEEPYQLRRLLCNKESSDTARAVASSCLKGALQTHLPLCVSVQVSMHESCSFGVVASRRVGQTCPLGFVSLMLWAPKWDESPADLHHMTSRRVLGSETRLTNVKVRKQKNNRATLRISATTILRILRAMTSKPEQQGRRFFRGGGVASALGLDPFSVGI